MKPFKKIKKKPKLVISETVYNKMYQLVDQSSTEISWHGFIKRDEEDHSLYYWYDIIMFPQYNTGATTTTDDTEYAEWLNKQAEHKNFNDMRLHGHSHVRMSVTPSAVDMNYREALTANLSKGDFYIFCIFNKSEDLSLMLYDAEQEIIFEDKDIAWEIDSKSMNAAAEWAAKVIQNNVKERKKPCSTTSNPKTSSTPKPSKKDQYMLSELERWADPFASSYADLDYLN